MQTHPIHVIDGRELALEVRSALFVFPEVLDVFVTGRPEVLVVVCSGHPRPARWLAELRTAGYHVSVRRRGQDCTLDVTSATTMRSGLAA